VKLTKLDKKATSANFKLPEEISTPTIYSSGLNQRILSGATALSTTTNCNQFA